MQKPTPRPAYPSDATYEEIREKTRITLRVTAAELKAIERLTKRRRRNMRDAIMELVQEDEQRAGK
jgi:hypothetical protein